MPDLNWTDQPAVCEGWPVVFRVHADGKITEVRSCRGGSYFLTFGTLFGSQTFKAANADVAFRLMHTVLHLGDKELRKLPSGVEFIEGPNVD